MDTVKTELEASLVGSGDILEMQAELCTQLAKLCHFDGYTLYFPKNLAESSPKLEAREHKLLLPLIWRGRSLGMLVLHKIRPREIRPVLSLLSGIVELCIENLALSKAQLLEPETGLCMERQLYERMCAEAKAVLSQEMAQRDLSSLPDYRICMGLVLLRLANGEELSTRCGYNFFSDLIRRSARGLQEALPPDVLAARISRYELGLLFHTPGREKCHDLADTALSVLTTVEAQHPISKQSVHPLWSAGYVYYPHDLSEKELFLPMNEQSHLAWHYAGLACDVALPGRSQSYAGMLTQGGRVVEVLPLGRYRINLGRVMGVRPGQCFGVFGLGRKSVYKGDVTVLLARKKSAVVEVRYQEEAGLLPEAGDVIRLLTDVSEPGKTESTLPPGQDFYTSLAKDFPTTSPCSLVMLHAEKKGEDFSLALNRARQALADVFEKEEKTIRVGRHGPNILVIFHPGSSAQDLVAPYTEMAGQLKAEAISVSVGIAGYPLLSFLRTELADCAVRALEYARLLPEPRVGLCNSLAFTISADKLYSLGNLFGALEEYKTAIVLDGNNDMAWNSMGVCLAALGQKEEARRQFLEALSRATEKEQTAQILYNLGTISQSLGDDEKAMLYFKQCVRQDKEHLYAWIRLGQLSEQKNDRNRARRMYERAAVIEESGKYHSNLAKLHLARMAASLHRGDEARSILQDALKRDPSDASAMLMLAQIFLDASEDPEIAESLARKSLSLHERPEAWQTLARALRALGQEEAATQAEARAFAQRSL